MTYDPDKSYDVDENGVSIRNSEGNAIFHFTAGVGVPDKDVPVGSRYYQIDDPTANWVKVLAGSGTDKWTNTNTQNSIVGNLWHNTFSEQGSFGNEFAENQGDSKNSDNSPFTVPFKSRLLAVTFENSDDNSDTDLELYRVPFGQGRGPNPANKVLTVSLRDTRIFVKNNYGTTDLEVEPGDKLALYGRDEGVNPDNINARFWWQVTGVQVLDASEQFSGRIRSE